MDVGIYAIFAIPVNIFMILAKIFFNLSSLKNSSNIFVKKHLLLTIQLRAICLMRYMSIVRMASYDVCLAAANCDDDDGFNVDVDIALVLLLLFLLILLVGRCCFRDIFGVFGADFIFRPNVYENSCGGIFGRFISLLALLPLTLLLSN